MKKDVQTQLFSGNKISMIRLSEITVGPGQPRTVFDEQSIACLADSIRQNGLLQPLSVRQIGRQQYELVAGERRLRALQQLGCACAPCIRIEAGEQRAAVLSILENIQREDLSVFEQAEGIARLISRWGVSQSEAAQRLGLSQSAVANKLRLLQLGEAERAVVIENGLSERHARSVLRLPDGKSRLAALRYIASNRLRVAQSERYVERLIAGENRGKTRLVFKDLRIFTNTIQMAVETMRRNGVMARAVRGENEDFIEYTIRIPKPQTALQKEG